MTSLLRRCAAFLLLVAGTAHAGSVSPYSAEACNAALAAGKPVVLEVHADWCPTCRAQAPIVQSLVKTPKYDAFTVFVVDYDQQKDVRKQFNVARQSTLIVFSQGKEVTRSTGDTAVEAIAAQFDKAL